MRRRMMLVGTALLLGFGGAACNGSHSSETPNNVQTQPGGSCQGKSCSPSAGATATTKPSDGDGTTNG